MNAPDPQAQRIAQLEQQVAQLTQQNAILSRELDGIAYAVSHDLRAPLRSLSGFSQALLEGIDSDSNRGNTNQVDANHLDATKTRHYLERIQQASHKLSILIDALLALSRIARAEMLLRDVDFSRLCEEVTAAIANRYPDRSVKIVITPNMVTHGDPRLLRLALECLLDNAWKFTANQATPIVEIGLTPSGEFFVTDNGIGFDTAYADKLFKPLQRLHSDLQFAGTGMGLATVQRIITRHNGHIRLDRNSNGGATAVFTIGKVG